MAIIKITDPIKLVQRAGVTYQGDYLDNKYILVQDLIGVGETITIIDQEGSNTIELTGGLTITSSILASNEMVLQLSNGASINIRRADTFTFDVGGNSVAGTEGVKKTFNQFVSDTFGVQVPSVGEPVLTVTRNITIQNDSTPTADGNSIPIDPNIYSNTNNALGTLSTINSEGVNGLDSGAYWSNELSTITYSFNNSIPSSYTGYDNNNKLTQGFTPLNEEQKSVVRSITNEINKLLGITLEEVEDNGLIRFNIIDMTDDTDNAITAGFAFYPSESPDYSGDVFLTSLYNDTETLYDFNLTQGREGWSTIVHELGHALGLKHPFEEGATLPLDLDNTAYTIMSYRNVYDMKVDFIKTSEGVKADFISVQPQLYSLYDVSTLQAIYGINNSSNGGNDVYTFNYNNFARQIIWDTGGNDTFDLSANLGDTVLDLNSGSMNSIDEYSFDEVVQEYQAEVNDTYFNSWIETTLNDLYESDKLYTGHNNIAIAQGVIIENATTGSGDDKVTDNKVDNIINTSAGNDNIYVGNGGYDMVNGGEGIDRLHIDLLLSSVTVKEYDGDYLLYSDDYAVKFENIEFVIFQDDSSYTPDALIA